MNVLKFEPRNAMDTRHTEHANAYIARSNGLIKSASTSTCCANENALFKKAHRKFLVNSENAADYEDETPMTDATEYLKLPSLSLSHAAVVARNASLLFNNEDVAAKKSLQHQLRYNQLKHFSDCNLNKIGLSAANNSSPVNGFSLAATAKCNGEYKHSEEFSSHRGLDNVLINRSSNGHAGSIINFTAVNDIKQASHSPAITNGMSSSSDNGCGPSETAADARSKQQPSEHGSVERRRKTSVFESAAQQLPGDDTNCAASESARNSDNGQAEVTPSEPQADDEDTRDQRSPASITTDKCGSPPPTPEKEEKRFRRSSSLKMPKESDSNPAQKKIVRFADALGLDLADVRTFLDELPSVPKSAYSDLQNDDSAPERLSSHSTSPDTKTLVPMFKQPHTSLNFLDRIRDNYVALEFAKVSPTPICSISGTVRVRNLDFFKSVYVRYTVDGWRTSNDLQAHYVPDSCDGFSDKFAFVIYLYDVKPNQRVELAVRFHCSGSIFWDNNNGSNYVFQCLPSAPIVPSYFHCLGPASDSCHSFY